MSRTRARAPAGQRDQHRHEQRHQHQYKHQYQHQHRHRQPTGQPAPPDAARPGRSISRARWRAAAFDVSVVALLLAVIATGWGLLGDAYSGPAAAREMLRGYDAVTLFAALPTLAGALITVSQGRSTRGRLVWVGLLGYLTYTYASYVFGVGFDDLFLLHIAVFTTSLVALVLAVGTFDVTGLAARFHPRTPVRMIGSVLALHAVALVVLWGYWGIDAAVTGDVPPGSALVETPTLVHLGIALDLSVLVPTYALAAALLWRRDDRGFLLAAVSLVAGAFSQLAYVVALPFQLAGDVPGAVGIDPVEPVIVLLYAAAGTMLLVRAPAAS